MTVSRDADVEIPNERGVSRRNFLQTLAAGATAIGAAGVAAAQNAPSAPQNVHAKRVLQPSDIQFAGWFRLPLPPTTDFVFSNGALASRVVNGQRRFFFSG